MELAIEIKERPILMHARSIRGILEGRKTQTRRIVKPQPAAPCSYAYLDLNEGWWTFGDNTGRLWRCPYGKAGERLWVRETAKLQSISYKQWVSLIYRADDAMIETMREDKGPFHLLRWTPGIHMPRWASRLTLEVTNIRVGPIQHISEQEIIAEGADVPYCQKCGYTRADCQTHFDHHLCGQQQPISGVPTFTRLWDETNGAGAWARNDWVWVIEFRRLENPQ